MGISLTKGARIASWRHIRTPSKLSFHAGSCCLPVRSDGPLSGLGTRICTFLGYHVGDIDKLNLSVQ